MRLPIPGIPIPPEFYIVAVKKCFDILIDAFTPNPPTPEEILRRAAWKNEVNIVKEFLEHGVSVDARGGSGNTALLVASKAGNTAVVKLLLESGADINAKCGHYKEPPLITSAYEDHIGVLKVLLGHPDIEVNGRDKGGRTALIHAAREGKIEAARLLIADQRTDINARDDDGRTTLHYVWHADILRLVLDNQKVETNSRDKKGRTPLIRIAKEGHKPLDFWRLIAQDPRVDINARDDKGKTALYYAVKRDRDSVAQLLREHGATD
ncbi:MAG: ankyrin repeat domain-containing protein [Pseudomonadota bacterium]